jgi:hypothetical protein
MQKTILTIGIDLEIASDCLETLGATTYRIFPTILLKTVGYYTKL